MSDSESLSAHLTAEVKKAMKSGEKDRLKTLRLVTAAIKQREVDERITLDDNDILVVLDKMVKQRRESIAIFETAGRDDLMAIEVAEIKVLQDFLPQALTDDEISTMIVAAIEKTGAASIKDMGRVMGELKPQMQGRADMGKVSGEIKAKLAG